MCKKCKRENDKRYYRKNKERMKDQIKEAKENRKSLVLEKVVEYLKENPCLHCSEINPIVLEFDHLHSKEYNVSTMISEGFGWEKVKKEIDKCQVLCANCHRIKTAKERNYKILEILGL